MKEAVGEAVLMEELQAERQRADRPLGAEFNLGPPRPVRAGGPRSVGVEPRWESRFGGHGKPGVAVARCLGERLSGHRAHRLEEAPEDARSRPEDQP